MTLLEQLKAKNILTSANQVNKQSHRMLTEHYTEMYQRLLLETSFLDETHSTRERIICIRDNIKSIPQCPVCYTPVTFNRVKGRFNQMCQNVKGRSCAIKDVHTQAARANTILSVYGVDNPSKNQEVVERRKLTNQARYGGNAPMHNEEVRRRSVETNFRRYNTRNPQLNPVIREKTQKTMIEKYGMPSYAQSKLDESTQSTLLKYRYDRDWLIDQHHTREKPISLIATELGISTHPLCERFKHFDIEIRTHDFSNQSSSQEMELHNFIIELLGEDIEVIANTRSIIPPYELDVYIPRYKLAFEYCGVYWHSELNGKNKGYHLKKRKECNNQGIRLITIWSSEWISDNQTAKSRIISILQKNTDIFYARKCTVKEITPAIANAFIEKNHTQGKCTASINYGLFYDDVQLVSVMGFSKNRFNKSSADVQWELIRFASLHNTSVVGAASKLFDAFVKQHPTDAIVSYSDNRWNNGNVYKQLGFKLKHTSAPNYHYFEQNGNTLRLYSRHNFQKHKLSKILPIFDPNLTEWQNMQNNGYDRIWDCGNDVFEWIP